MYSRTSASLLTLRRRLLANALRGLLHLLQRLQPAGRMHGATLYVRLGERYQIRSRHIVRYVRLRPVAQALQHTDAALVAHADVVGHGERAVGAARRRRADLRHLFGDR